MRELIDKQNTINIIMSEPTDLHYPSWYAELVKEIQPEEQQKKGKWIKPTGMMPPEHHGHYECSNCGFWAMKDWLRPWKGVVLTNYCPGCGLKMEV